MLKTVNIMALVRVKFTTQFRFLKICFGLLRNQLKFQRTKELSSKTVKKSFSLNTFLLKIITSGTHGIHLSSWSNTSNTFRSNRINLNFDEIIFNVVLL